MVRQGGLLGRPALDVLDSQGRSVAVLDPEAPSRQLTQSVPGRTVIGG